MTRYRIYRNLTGEATYISAHEGSDQRDPQVFPNLDIALAALREGGIPEYEIRRVSKELAAINGAIVQTAGTVVFGQQRSSFVVGALQNKGKSELAAVRNDA